jgi:hypothetical protein
MTRRSASALDSGTLHLSNWQAAAASLGDAVVQARRERFNEKIARKSD